MKMKEVYLVNCCRTAVGKFQGSLAKVPAPTMGGIVIKEALKRAGIAPENVDEVMFGCILTGGLGQNPARQACLNAGIPYSVPAYTVGMVCGSGMKSVIEAARAIAAGEADVVVAGGQENMTAAPYSVPTARDGARMFNTQMVDTMVNDGLWDAFHNYHMGTTAENICDLWGITREDLDQFAAASQAKTAAAQAAGKFEDEIVPVPVKVKKETVEFKVDEFPRASTTFESLSKLKGAFPVGPESEAIQEQGRKIAAGETNVEGPITLTFEAKAIHGPAADAGTKRVTAGNASGINDGAAAIILASKEAVEKYGLKPMAKLVSYGQGGVDPKIMGVGPVPASRQALAKANLTIDDIDLIEANEAFAAQSIAVARELEFDMDKVNVNGGAISIGHPVGASGARIIVTLIHEMLKRNSKYGLATLCIGGGMGVATIWEKC
jgi:acetyl-CoA C-acetyltransferase